MSFDRFFTSVRSNLPYLLVWTFAVATVVFINIFAAKSFTFIGITESKALNINLKNAVVIKSINVVSGQKVKKGQLLMELQRPDLTLRINEVSHKLEELVSQYKLNDRLNGQLESIKTSSSDRDEDLLGIQIRSLEKELKLLYTEKEELYIFCSFDGYVGPVNFKNGESVSPFETILSVHDKTPTKIKAYIHENNADKVSNDLKVNVSTISGKRGVTGKILNVGTQIVEFPERFLRSTGQKLWGREVTVEIPVGTDLLLGEKVFIELTDEKIDSLKPLVSNKKSSSLESIYNRITVPDELKSDHLFEPSGATYVSDLNKYLFVSDDTNEDKPIVNILNQDGSVDNHIIEIEGLEQIKDMESIVQDEKGVVYISSSLSLSKKNKITNARKQFIRVKRDGLNLKLTGKINLYDKLNELAKLNINKNWVKLLRNPNADKLSKYYILLDVEGIFVKNNVLYLGLRRPLGKNKEIVILMIKDINLSLDENSLNLEQVSIARQISLPVKVKEDRYEGISDLLMVNDDLYILTANNKGINRGRVLKTKMLDTFPVEEVTRYSKHRPEGLAYNSTNKMFRVFFENNKGSDIFFSEFSL